MFTEQQCQKKNPNTASNDTTMISEVICWEGLELSWYVPKLISSASPLSLQPFVTTAGDGNVAQDALSERLYIYFLKPGMVWSSNSQFSVVLVAMGPSIEYNPGRDDNVDWNKLSLLGWWASWEQYPVFFPGDATMKQLHLVTHTTYTSEILMPQYPVWPSPELHLVTLHLFPRETWRDAVPCQELFRVSQTMCQLLTHSQCHNMKTLPKSCSASH